MSIQKSTEYFLMTTSRHADIGLLVVFVSETKTEIHSYLFCSPSYYYFRFGGSHFEFVFGLCSVSLGILDNLGVATAIALLFIFYVLLALCSLQALHVPHPMNWFPVLPAQDRQIWLSSWVLLSWLSWSDVIENMDISIKIKLWVYLQSQVTCTSNSSKRLICRSIYT